MRFNLRRFAGRLSIGRRDFVSLFGFKEKKEIERLQSLLTPELQQLDDVLKAIELKEKQLTDYCKKSDELQKKIEEKQKELENLQSEIVQTDEEILLQSFGIYAPRYAFSNSTEYKEALTKIREKQKQMIKEDRAILGDANWTVNGNRSQGKKMVNDTKKLLLRAFNSECDDIVEHVKFSNLDASQKRMDKSRTAISNLGKLMQISISPAYYNAKKEELYLAYEYAEKKQQEKEEQKEVRARMREEAKLAKELEEARRNIEKEQKHYKNALEKLNAQLASCSDAEKQYLQAKQAELINQLEKIERSLKDVDYRQANQKAGYVYIISNIGAFGEDVYKIGMTRRLAPMERVDELGDASVPFDFDVHAMIFTEDAPKLEAALHNAFADRKLNFVNTRREFFKVSLGEIKQVVRQNFDKTVEFVDTPPAEQYRQSMVLRENNIS